MSNPEKCPSPKNLWKRTAHREHAAGETSPDTVLRFDRCSLEAEMIRVRSALRAGDSPDRCSGHGSGP